MIIGIKYKVDGLKEEKVKAFEDLNKDIKANNITVNEEFVKIFSNTIDIRSTIINEIFIKDAIINDIEIKTDSFEISKISIRDCTIKNIKISENCLNATTFGLNIYNCKIDRISPGSNVNALTYIEKSCIKNIEYLNLEKYNNLTIRDSNVHGLKIEHNKSTDICLFDSHIDFVQCSNRDSEHFSTSRSNIGTLKVIGKSNDIGVGKLDELFILCIDKLDLTDISRITGNMVKLFESYSTYKTCNIPISIDKIMIRVDTELHRKFKEISDKTNMVILLNEEAQIKRALALGIEGLIVIAKEDNEK